MLAHCKAVAFVGASDLGRARGFYEGVLGLVVLAEDEFAVMAQAGGVSVRVARAETVAPAPYTVMGFEVEDIAAVVDGLRARGVAFEHYPFFGANQDAQGVWTAPSGARVAWFKDPDGNLLSLAQMA